MVGRETVELFAAAAAWRVKSCESMVDGVVVCYDRKTFEDELIVLQDVFLRLSSLLMVSHCVLTCALFTLLQCLHIVLPNFTMVRASTRRLPRVLMFYVRKLDLTEN